MSDERFPMRVIGCGSPHGDDAVAWEIVRQLRSAGRLPKDVDIRSVEGGHQILDILDGQGTLILVDALASGAAPGTIHRLEWPNARFEFLRAGSTHLVRPGEALELAATLGLLPHRVIVFGIEAEQFQPALGLSPSVAAAVPNAVRLIGEELEA